MNRHALIRTMQTRILQPQKERGIFCHADRERSLCNPPSTPSPGNSSFAWQDGRNDAGHRRTWFTRALLLQPDTWQATQYSFTAGLWHGHPSFDALQTGVSIERQFSRIFPAHLRSLARCLSRARRELRGSASLCNPSRSSADLPGTPALRAPCGFRFPENLLRTERAKHFPDPPKKRRLPLGAGHLTSLRAGVSRRQSGQIQTGEKPWHFMETTSR